MSDHEPPRCNQCGRKPPTHAAHCPHVAERFPLSEAAVIVESFMRQTILSEALPSEMLDCVRSICRLRGTSSTRERALGLVEICALLGEPWIDRDEPPECSEDPASCDCGYHENLRRAEASHV
jgi:hypothetical protein